MKQLKRNKIRFYYAKLNSNERAEYIDPMGNRTGQYYPVRTEPVEAWGNIAPPTGFANVEKFGNIVSYDINITLEDPKTPIDETTVLWVYTDPNQGEPFDFMVRRVTRSLNSATLQCAQAKVHAE